MTEAYLAEHGFTVPEHEPDLGVGVRIEYLLEVGEDSCALEVKEFALESNPIKGSGSYSQQQMLKPIRGQVREAATKLKRAKDLGHPLVIVLTDPQGAMSGIIGPREMIAALRGDMAVHMGLSAAGTITTPPALINGRNGKLRNDHQYISAVVVIRKGFLDDAHFAHTYITHAPDSLPLPDTFFRGPRDSVFEYSPAHDAFFAAEPASQG